MQGLQRAFQALYPPQCLLCQTVVEDDLGLCADCWRDTPFLTGLACEACGAGLLGEGAGEAHFCDDCLAMPRPWERGRAALSYRAAAKRIVLALKHGDRTDLANPISGWLAHAGRDILADHPILVPVPIHWTRLLSRRYNQAAEISRALAKRSGLQVKPDALIRTKRTNLQDGMGVDQRFANLLDAIRAHPKHGTAIKGRNVCIVDDVMTSGATLAASTDAAFAAGATRVDVLVLARVEKSF